MIRISLPVQAGILVLAVCAPFFFPSILTALLAFCAALVFPPFAIALGILTDFLYQPAGYWPFATVIGVVFCLLAIAVRSFVKTRIM